MPTWLDRYPTPPRRLVLADDGLHFSGPPAESWPLDALDGAELPARIIRDFGHIALAEVRMLRALALAPPPAPTGEACACGVQARHEHHHLDTFAREQDHSAPIDYLITAARCRACGRLWTFEESGDTRYEYRWYARPLSAVLP